MYIPRFTIHGARDFLILESLRIGRFYGHPVQNGTFGILPRHFSPFYNHFTLARIIFSEQFSARGTLPAIKSATAISRAPSKTRDFLSRRFHHRGLNKFLRGKKVNREPPLVWFSKKTSMTAEGFANLDDELKQYAFTVAGLEKNEHISAVAQKLTEAFDQGASYTTFKKSLAGLGPEIDALADARLRTVYRQNIFSAYSEGRYKQMMESVEYLPNWEYITIGDGRVRPAHAALNGTVRRYDDPFWNTWYPPNGFNCRCVVEVTTKEPSGNGTPSPRDGVYGSPAKDGRGLPSWNKELADKAMEAGSPMRELDRYKGTLTPDKGFDRNDAGMSRWIGEKGEQAVKKALAFGVDNASKAGVRTQLLKTTEVPIRWDESKNILVKDNITTQNAVEIIQKQVNADSVILDFDGAPVYVDAKEILKHITNKKGENYFETRKVILPKIKEILSNPQEAWGQFEKYPGKNGTLVFAKKYLANINGEPYMLVVEFIKEGKDKGIPYLTTVYKIRAEELASKRSGVLLK